MEKESNPISSKEKIVIILVIFLVKMLKPWQFDHQFTSFWEEIKQSMEK